MQLMSDYVTRLGETCMSKCVTSYYESELNVGEGSCMDRCFQKYNLASQVISKIMEQHQKTQMQQHLPQK